MLTRIAIIPCCEEYFLDGEGLQVAQIINGFLKFLDEAPKNVKITQVACGEYHTTAIADNGDVYTWGLSHMGQLGHRSL